MREDPTVAMVLVIRNEDRFLEAHLRYHREIGIGRVYAYLDRCTDRSLQILRDTADVDIVERDRSDDEAYMSVYQCNCLGDALVRARRDGVDWLMHLDPDEFAHGEGRGEDPSIPKLVKRAATRWRGLGRRVDQIVMRTVEVIPTPLAEHEDFRDLRWFQDGGVWVRQVLDPDTGVRRALTNWLGNRRGKSLLRVDAEAEPASAHAWRREGGGDLVTTWAGRHLHYVVTDPSHWLEKYRKFSEFPSRWEKGNPVRFPKQAWKEASVRMSEEEAEAYFREEVAVEPAVLERVVATRAGRFLRRDATVAEVLQRC